MESQGTAGSADERINRPCNSTLLYFLNDFLPVHVFCPVRLCIVSCLALYTDEQVGGII